MSVNVNISNHSRQVARASMRNCADSQVGTTPSHIHLLHFNSGSVVSMGRAGAARQPILQQGVHLRSPLLRAVMVRPRGGGRALPHTHGETERGLWH